MCDGEEGVNGWMEREYDGDQMNQKKHKDQLRIACSFIIRHRNIVRGC